MAKHVSDQEIQRSAASAHELLGKLGLSDVESVWAKESGQELFKSLTDRFLNDENAFGDLRPLVVSAALAFALSFTKDWAEGAEKMRRGS